MEADMTFSGPSYLFANGPVDGLVQESGPPVSQRAPSP